MTVDTADMYFADNSPYADLGGVFEVAQALGVDAHRVKRWIERRDSTRCPQPLRILHMGHVYSLGEWRAWFALWRITRGHASWSKRR